MVSKHTPYIKCAEHLRLLLNRKELKRILPIICKHLKTIQFDAIAFRGLSGAMIAPIVALRLNKSLLAVRKDGEKTHSCYKVEGDYGARRYIILDDFISGGNTARAILAEVKAAVPDAEFVGFYAYHDDGWMDKETCNARYKTIEEAPQCCTFH